MNAVTLYDEELRVDFGRNDGAEDLHASKDCEHEDDDEEVDAFANSHETRPVAAFSPNDGTHERH